VESFSIPPEESQFSEIQSHDLDGMVWYGILEFNLPLDTV